MSAADYMARCKKALVKAAMQAVLEEETARRPAQLALHNSATLSALYGCRVEQVQRFITEDGELQVNGIAPAEKGQAEYRLVSLEPLPGHCVAGPWRQGAAGAAALEGVRALNLELRGLSRALWLAVLWSGADPSAVRPQWYHWTSTGPYWPVAWQLTYGCPPAERQARRQTLLNYAEACCSAYTAQHATGRRHASCAYFAAVRSIWGL